MLVLGIATAADPGGPFALAAANPQTRQAAARLEDGVWAALRRGEPDAALAPAKRALLLRLGALGPDHPETLGSFNALARVYEEQGDDERARACCLRALRGRQRVLGPDHRDVAVSLNNLAMLTAGDRPVEAV